MCCTIGIFESTRDKDIPKLSTNLLHYTPIWTLIARPRGDDASR